MSLSFQQKLQNYAALAVRVGVNVQPGQRLIIMAPIEAAALARLAVEEAYKAGARLVDVLWNDDAVTLARFQHAPRDSFEEYPTWRSEALREIAEAGDAILMIRATDPDLLKGQDGDLIATVQKTENKYLHPFRERQGRNDISWTIVSAPIPAWASKIYPDDSPQEAVEKLWETLFKAVRADQADPVAAWQQHADTLGEKRDILNSKQYSALHFKGNGTDLKVGLPEGHRWASASSNNKAGTRFIANIPTEEAFTAPHKDKVEGRVQSAKPLSYGGVLIENFGFRFEGGKAVEAWAERGEEAIQRLLKTDEGATRLGEVALVPHSSPISQTGLLFYNTLYDENASSHLAFGRAYRFNIAGGETMAEEDFAAAGGNNSLIHVDFMIGAKDTDVDGVLPDGTVEPVMRAGEWAL